MSRFEVAIQATPDVAGCYKQGLQGLGQHSSKVILANLSKCEGSINIDDCTSKKYPQANRWDYALSYKSEVLFVEVHSAHTKEITTVIKKHDWLKNWLVHHAPEIDKLKPRNKPSCFWIQTNGFHISKTSPQLRRAIAAGLRPISQLRLEA